MTDRKLSLTPGQREAHRATLVKELQRQIDAASTEVDFFTSALAMQNLKPARGFDRREAEFGRARAEEKVHLATAQLALIQDEWVLFDNIAGRNG